MVSGSVFNGTSLKLKCRLSCKLFLGSKRWVAVQLHLTAKIVCINLKSKWAYAGRNRLCSCCWLCKEFAKDSVARFTEAGSSSCDSANIAFFFDAERSLS